MNRARIVFLAAAVVWPSAAIAGTPMRIEDGRDLTFVGEPDDGVPHLRLVGNTLNVGQVFPDPLFDAVTHGLAAWQAASGDAFTWDYWQGADLETHAVGLRQDGVSAIFFASAVGPEQRLGAGTPAFAQTWVDPDTAEIVEFDIVLNDYDFRFVDDPEVVRDAPNNRTLLLQSVVLHELGHGFGLDHSAVLDATMVTWAWPNQDTLSCDDLLAVRERFGTSEGASVRARLDAPDGTGLLGGQLIALRDDGTVVASATADASGEVELKGLEPGRYAFVVDPFSPGPEVLTSGYAEMPFEVCDGVRASRTAAEGMFEIDTGQAVDLGTLAVDCGPSFDAATALGATEHVEEAPIVLDGSMDDRFMGFERLVPSEQRVVRLDQIEGTLRIHATGWGLFSPIAVRMELRTLSGFALPGFFTRPIEVDETSGFTRWDAVLEVPDVPLDDYVLELESDLLVDTLYPGGLDVIDADPFVFISGGVNLPEATDACVVPEPENLDYASPSAPPPLPTIDPDGPGGCAVAPAVGGWTWIVWLMLGTRRRPRAPRGGHRRTRTDRRR